MIRLLGIVGLLGLMLQPTTMLAQTNDFGLMEILSDWRSSSKHEDSEFLKRHQMLACAESVVVFGAKDVTHRQDPAIARQSLESVWRHHWHNPSLWIPETLNFVRTSGRHSMLSAPYWLELVSRLSLAYFLALQIVLTLTLWLWARPIAKDWPRLLRSARVVRLLLVIVALLSITFGAFFWTALLLATCCVTYSRRAGPLVILWALTFLFGLARPTIQVVSQTAQQTSVFEALWQGRTRLYYPDIALKSLTPTEQAAWALMNGDRKLSRSILDAQPASRDKALLTSLHLVGDVGPMRALLDVQNILSQCDTDPVCNFNLAQISTDTQNLVAADRARAKIDSQTLERLTLRSIQQQSLYLWLPSQSLWQRFWSTFTSNLKDKWNFKEIVWWIMIPLALLGLALLFRRRASGVCNYTAEPTATLATTESALYQSARSRGSQKTTGSQRFNTEGLIRDFRHLTDFINRWWGCVIPAIQSVTSDFRPVSAVILLTGLCSLWIFALPPNLAERLLEHASLFSVTASHSQSSHQGFLVLAGSWQLFLCWQAWRRTQR